MKNSTVIRVRAAGWSLILSIAITLCCWKPLENMLYGENERLVPFSSAVVVAGVASLVVVFLKSLPIILNLTKKESGRISRRFWRQASNGTVRFDTYYFIVNDHIFKVDYQQYDSLSIHDHVTLTYFRSFFPFRGVIEPFECQKQ